jgi:hypothetical protein
MPESRALPPFDPGAIDHRQLRDLHAYWLSRHAEGALPGRRSLDPLDVPHLLPYMMLIDVWHEPFDLRYRLVGTALVDHMGRDTTRMRVEDAYVGADWPKVEQDYKTAIFDKRPVLRRNEGLDASGRRFAYERLLLPLSADGLRVDMLLGGAVFEEA